MENASHEHIPWLERQRQTATCGFIFIGFILAIPIGWSLYFYLLTSRFWPLALLYLIWLYCDRETPELGGRPISIIQNGKLWQYCKKYYPSKLTLAPGFTLDPNRNYLFCFFPHGIIPNGPYIGLTSGVCDFQNLYPKFKVQMAMLGLLFYTPFMREVGMGMGLVSCSAKSLNYLLGKPNGGQIVNLSPGGAIEAYFSRPGLYCFNIKKRKGFVKMALKNGAPLVPVITFGEVELFDQVELPMLRPVQEFIRKKIGFAPVFFYGTGICCSFGWTPRRRLLMTVLGKPIEVNKVDNPTSQEIDELHGRFVEELVGLFEKYKYKFLEKPEEQCLVLR